MSSNYRRCNTCKKQKIEDASEFKVQRDGFSKTCSDCLKKKQASFASKKTPNKENPADDSNKEDDNEINDVNLLGAKAVELDAFLASLSAYEDIKSISAYVNISSIQAPSMRETADKVAKAIWESLRYRFTYVISN